MRLKGRSISIRSERGFSLLETLFALTILALVLGALYPVFTRAIVSPNTARQQLELTEFARSTLEEYVISYPAMALSGSYAGQWSWSISERIVPGKAVTRYDDLIDLVEVSITAKILGQNNRNAVLNTVVARKAARK